MKRLLALSQPQRRPAIGILRVDKPHQEFQEQGLLRRRQCGDGAVMRALDRQQHFLQRRGATCGEGDKFETLIGGGGAAFDELFAFQPGENIGERRAVDADFIGELGLVEPGLRAGDGEDAVLNGGDVEGGTFFGEEGEVNLVHAAD